SNLRSALDHLVYEMSSATIANPSGTGFPICDGSGTGRGDFNHPAMQSLMKHLRANANGFDPKQVIESVQPYNGRWQMSALNHLRNLESHRTFTFTGSGTIASLHLAGPWDMTGENIALVLEGGAFGQGDQLCS